MGGFDVFKTKFQGTEWSQPENLGYPVNSGTDDIFYSYNKAENTGYYTTMRKDGGVGNYDIYMFKYLQPLKVTMLVTYNGNLTPKNLKVTILGAQGKDSTTVAVNPKADVLYKSNREYRVLIPRYNNDSILDTLRFKTPESFGGYSCMQEIVYEPVKNYKNLVVGYKTTVYNAFFDIEKDIEKSGARNTRVLMDRFPMCKAINHQYSYYSKPNLTKDEEYLGYIKSLKSDHQNFKMYSQTSYIDTSSFVSIYKMQDSIESSAKEALKGLISNNDTVGDHKALVKKAKPEIKKHEPKIKTFTAVHFETGKSELAKQYENEIKKIANYLRENESLLLELVGYPDTDEADLAEERALAVKRALMKYEISTDRIKAVGVKKVEKDKQSSVVEFDFQKIHDKK